MSNPDQYTEADAAEYEAKLNDIANDPDLTLTEKLDDIGDAMKEEFEEIGLDTTADADTTTGAEESATTASTTTATENSPAGEASATADVVGDSDLSLTERIDEIYNSLNDTTATTATGTAPAGDAASTADVVGDPATATYSSAPAAGTSTPSAAETVEDPATSGPASDLTTAVGVDGNVDYYSPRDVDRDGSVDLAHSRVDGIDTITHYNDDDGSITLVEQDTDHNGTYETAAAVRPDGTVRIAEDSDDDGQVDLATYYDPTTVQPVRQDEFDGSGRITASKIDSDGDGQPDVYLIDTDGDGRFDTVDLDTDADAITNDTLIDTDGDGRFDLSLSDTDGDGSQETYRTAATSGDGTLGDISTYESLIPADDSYHTQAGTDTYEPPVVDEVPGDLV
ncbi:hypothetical protein AB4Z09_26235 [Rhodococcus sp. TAF43]|uniref:hypothetical protein n=1 Tax=Rhodococcus sp. TAF43 TaxID=3237483 RepID=UPI003F948165